jgi:hypothetical protein
MITRDTDKYLAVINRAYSMLGTKTGYSGKIDGGEEPTMGFMVAIRELKSYDKLQDVMVGELTGLLEEAIKELAIQDLYIGSFIDPDDGKVSFEVSINVMDFDTAISWGKKGNQKYIYDVVNEANISVND